MEITNEQLLQLLQEKLEQRPAKSMLKMANSSRYPRRIFLASGAYCSSIRQTSPLYARLNWQTFRTIMKSSRRLAAKSTPYPWIPISYTRHGMNLPIESIMWNML